MQDITCYTLWQNPCICAVFSRFSRKLGQLSQFGFHWNNSRKCWQHPCGQFATEGSGADPRQKYGSHFAADLKAA